MTSKTSGEPKSRGGASAPVAGYDVVRLVAMALVALQHALAVSRVEHRFDYGQLGVTLFCALSGFFAFRSGDGDPPFRWLARRLDRIYLPYWISLVAIFAANRVVHYKKATLWLIISEFLGSAYFTHPDGMVGVHTWFISLILLCYGVAALVRWRSWLLPVFVIIAMVSLPLDAEMPRHVLSFLAGAVIATAPQAGIASSVAALMVALACLGAAVAAHAQFTYPMAGALALLGGGLPRRESPRFLALSSRATYEFFLVHGAIYLGLAYFFKAGLVGTIAIGTPIAIGAAWVLNATSRAVRSSVGRLRVRLTSLPGPSPIAERN